MGRVCAWCGALLSCHASSSGQIRQAVCGGCLAELETTLSSVGLRLTKPGGAATGQAPRHSSG